MLVPVCRLAYPGAIMCGEAAATFLSARLLAYDATAYLPRSTFLTQPMLHIQEYSRGKLPFSR
jgi:hypothetical protein